MPHWFTACRPNLCGCHAAWGSAQILYLIQTQYANFSAVKNAWQPITRDWRSFLQVVSDADCRRIVEYQNTRGEEFSLPLVDILQHVVNHATEHRSQITHTL